MSHKYHTYVYQPPTLRCFHCKKSINVGDEFAVTSTPSSPCKNTCLECTDRMVGDDNFSIDDTPSTKVATGVQRT